MADLCHYISTKETYTKLNLVKRFFWSEKEITPRAKFHYDF
jgi:hypothetical protein